MKVHCVNKHAKTKYHHRQHYVQPSGFISFFQEEKKKVHSLISDLGTLSPTASKIYSALKTEETKREYFSLNVCGVEPKKKSRVFAVMLVTTSI